MGNIFSPQTKNLEEDKLNKGFLSVAKYIFIFIFGLLPILFIPNSLLSLDYNKAFLASSAAFVVFILLSLVSLRTGKIKLSLPVPIWFFWTFVLWALISAFLTEDIRDAVFGNALEIQTVGFFVLLASVLTLVFKLAETKKFIAHLLSVLSFSLLILLIFQVARLFSSSSFLNLGVLTNSAESLVGNVNNLAVVAGLVTVISLALLRDIGRGIYGKTIITIVLFLSMFILSAIDFSFAWYVVGGFTLLFLISFLFKGTWVSKGTIERVPKIAFLSSVLVSVAVAGFLFLGSSFDGFISDDFRVNYSEITLSSESTIVILKEVYKEDVLFGVGPNRFEDAWRLHKDPMVNLTGFWNVDFLMGNNFISTLFVNTGAVGGILFLGFLLSFLKTGIEVLFFKKEDKENLQETQFLVFSSALYLWVMVFLFNPNTTLLLLTILMTGLSLALAKNFKKIEKQELEVEVVSKRSLASVFLSGGLVVVFLGSWFFVNITKQYLAENNYNKAVLVWNETADFKETDEFLIKANDLFASDEFLAERARLRFGVLSELMAKNPENLTEEEVGKIQNYTVEGIELANRAVLLDKTNPRNYLLLINFYRILGIDENEEVRNLVKNALSELEKLDKTNVEYKVLSAKLLIGLGDFSEARKVLQEALILKKDYVETYRHLAQVAIKENKIEEAVFEIQKLLEVDSSNPARYLELGILLSELGREEEAEVAFLEAIKLDSYYADARYFLALTYLKLDRKEEAINQLYKIKETNQESQELLQSITVLEESL